MSMIMMLFNVGKNRRMDPKWKVYAMVDQGFKEELEDCGVSYIGYGPEKTKIIPKTVSTDKIKEVR